MGWIGVDLDGTLAYWSDDSDVMEIGSPIHNMQNRVIDWVKQGKDVRIVTARVSYNQPAPDTDLHDFVTYQRVLIGKWCKKHIGRVLPITCSKDYLMEELWDDRAITVRRNIGTIIGDYREA